MFIFESGRDSANGGRGRDRGRHRIKAGSRLRAVSTEPDVGLKLRNRDEIMTGAKVGRFTDRATQTPREILLLLIFFKFCF